MDLGNLLKSLGLERFETAFRDNGIDESVLTHLTQDHLRELGLPLGARIRLLANIAALSKESESHTPAAMAAEGSPADAAEPTKSRVV
jgi:SAM domain (Sterile alpha motif)